MMLRLGITPVQRLHREAISEHGDALLKGRLFSLSVYYHLRHQGARATMRPYASNLEEAQIYFQSLNYPISGSGISTTLSSVYLFFLFTANAYNRGGYPVRGGDRVMKFTPDQLREAEKDTQVI